MSKTQAQPPSPAAEPARLMAVPSNEWPGSAPELEFDTAARLAARVFGASAAFAALADAQRLTVKASTGIDAPWLERVLASWPDALVRPGELLVVEDLAADARLAGSALVAQAPHLRFYAAAPVVDSAGRALGILGVLDPQPRRVAEIERERSALADLSTLLGVVLQVRRHGAELAVKAMVDPLTGVANRKQFDQVVLAELHHSMRTGDPFTLLLLSLDGMGDIRDGFGAEAGDAALREVAARMARQVRLGDLLARLGGDEFAVLMRHGAADEAEVLATRIVAAVREPLRLDSGDMVGVLVCIGIAAYSDRIESLGALMGNATTALQQARKQHERRWSFFGRKLEPPALRLVGDDEPQADDPKRASGG